MHSLSQKFTSIFLTSIALILFLFTTEIKAKQQNTIPKDTLLVGIAGSEPFVFSDVNKGISIEIWENIAAEKKWNYKYKSFNSVEDALKEIHNNNLDLVIGPISITSTRLKYMKFSQPFYNSSLAIMSRVSESTLWDKVKPLFSFKLLIAVGIFLIILTIVGTLLWLAERKKSPDQFPSKPIDGIGTGMWLAIVTMSTTGYGDKAPITLSGRIIAGTWMIVSIIFATSMVAGIASTLTLSSLDGKVITNIEQLKNKKVATISGSPSQVFLKENNAKVDLVLDLEAAIEKLNNKEVEAVVYDRPQLLYYQKSHKDDNLHISKAQYYKLGYGFAFPMNTEYLYYVNRALLELSEHQEINEIVNGYLDKDE